MKLTFKLVAATDLTTFNELVNSYLAKDYKFVQGQSLIIIAHEDISGQGLQYSVPMLLEQE